MCVDKTNQNKQFTSSENIELSFEFSFTPKIIGH